MSLFISSLSYADICQFQAQHFDNLTVQTGKFNSGPCFISLTPRKTLSLIYRSFLLTTEGQIMVFNSFGGGPINTDTGSRVFHTFPKVQSLQLQVNEETVEVTLVTGQVMTFDKILGEPTNLTEGLVNIDPIVKPANNGGVEFEMDSALLLDSGFRFGGTPLSRLARESVFTDFEGDKCSVKNSELFDVKDGEIYHLYSSEIQLRNFLRTRCPQLDY